MGKAQLEKKVKEMCDRLLANTIIEDYEFEVGE
jgi:phosphoribosylformylglycinamidine synthase PurS subunit